MGRSAEILQIALCLSGLVLVVETSSSVSWARQVLHRTKRQAECQTDEFRCTSGECIDIVSMCDGTKNCADGSDGTEKACKQLNVNSSSPSQRGGCLLPQPPEFGNYTALVCGFGNKKSAACRHVPGTPVPENWLLAFRCNEGYYINETQDERFLVFCADGKWSSDIPVCRKMCSPLQSSSVSVKCFNGVGNINCSKAMRPGTRAKGECKSSYTQIEPPPYTELVCRDDGQWSDELFYCQPGCGKSSIRRVNKPLIAHDSSVQYGEFPWHAGLYYMNRSGQWEEVCEGNLISPHIVLTAAHCVYFHIPFVERKPEEFKVGLGKYEREWTVDEPNAVKADVRKIFIPRRYYGDTTFHAQDIALLELTTSVQGHEIIMPVCIDWKHEFTITPGMKGKLVGWGRTESKRHTDDLLYADLTYIDYKHCLSEVPRVAHRYVTPDKFCARLDRYNDTVPSPVSSGGSLTFVQDDFHYLHGILSTGKPPIIFFTNISNEEILSWLNYTRFDEAYSETRPSLPQAGSCLLPQPPEFGNYSAPICQFDDKIAACSQMSGTHVPQNWLLSFTCNEGYYVKETQDKNFLALCVSGKWSPKIPVCKKMCSPLVSLSISVRCFNGGDNIDCSKSMRPGTRAKAKCKPTYTQIRPPPYTEIFCQDSGQWSYERFYCQPGCGKTNTQGINNPLIVDGSVAKYSELPWHVGIYQRNSSKRWQQTCGGTLISPHIVLTAAQCVFSEQIQANIPPEAIKVGLGKYYREWTHHEAYAVQADVRKILIPPRYHGEATNYTQDIALLDLTHSVQVHAGIMPACVDWKRQFIITPDMLGTRAGWDRRENGTYSEVLLYADLEYIDYRQCLHEVPQVFRHYVTFDKFCAGFIDGPTAGDSGGGLTFLQNDLHYVYGIASTKVQDDKSVATFTNVSNQEILDWLYNAKRILDEEHPENCPPTSFQCASGICIDGNKRCNGYVDCADGSDEGPPECSEITATTQVSVPLKCKETKFNCMSGQCVDKYSVCDGRVDCLDGSDETESQCSSVSPQGGGCLLPQPPELGAYTAAVCPFQNKTTVCAQIPGTSVSENWALSFKCNEGYYIKESGGENFYAFCVNGQWSPKIPICRKMCSPLISLSVVVRCFNGEGDADCSKPMRPGTRAKVECKPSYNYIQPPSYSEIFCQDSGQWSYELFNCQPVCGKRNIKGVNNPLIAHGSVAERGEFPWHAGLYTMNEYNQWEQACGGSLISPHIVITAAHCVFSEAIAEKLPPEAIKVGLGKYYREWNHKEPHAVQANVRKILIPPRYDGDATSLAHDIALIDLTESVELHTGIMPVCINWQLDLIVTPGMIGMLAGWGKTENGTTSDVLRYADLPYVDHRSCLSQMSQPFRHYVTTDKFCAGYTNGTGAAKGDSGGGLTFVREHLHYLHGIVSTKVKDESSFITFTDVSNLELFRWLTYSKYSLEGEWQDKANQDPHTQAILSWKIKNILKRP